MAVTDIGTLITSTSGVCGGRPRIAGTRLTVQTIAHRWREGLSAEEIAGDYGHITVAQVYAALAYYHANRDAVERQMAEDEAGAVEAERHWLKERGLPPNQGPP